MSDVNAPVKNLLRDVESIVTNQFETFSTGENVDKIKLAVLQKKLDNEIERFKQPEVWLQPLVIKESDIFSHLLAINKIEVPELDELATQIELLMGVLETALPASLSELTTNSVNITFEPNRNLETLGLLSHIDGVMIDVMLMFMEKNIDLAANSDYQATVTEQETLLKDYRKKLKEETVMAVEDDVTLLKLFAKTFQAVEEVDLYLKDLDQYNDFIKRRAAVA